MKYIIILIIVISCTQKQYTPNYEYMNYSRVPVKNVYLTTGSKEDMEYKDPIQDSINALIDMIFPYSDAPAIGVVVDSIPRYIKKKGIYYPYDTVYFESEKY